MASDLIPSMMNDSKWRMYYTEILNGNNILSKSLLLSYFVAYISVSKVVNHHSSQLRANDQQTILKTIKFEVL